MSTETLGPCPLCKFEIEVIDEYGTRSCSAFCSDANDREKQAFRSAKSGDYCVYPCPACGATLEGEWTPETPKDIQCTACARKKRDVLLREALKDSRAMLVLCRGTVVMNSMPGVEVLMQSIDEALKY